jgi:curved DNA-binding protein CbpA
MVTEESPTYYDILDLKPDASPQEVREAYLRTKATYNKDSVALYTLVSPEEREEMLRRIEEAYEILSSPEKRRNYDQHHGLISEEIFPVAQTRGAPVNKKIVSIDRVPPMETGASGDDLLIAPTTDFTKGQPAAQASSLFGDGDTPPAPPPTAASIGAPAAPAEPPIEVGGEKDWPGAFLRKVRETRRVSVEEMAAVTKITKNYILAIEEENFAKLPAAVYLRGFIIQIAKVLKLPHEKVAGGYMARYYQARPDQNH